MKYIFILINIIALSVAVKAQQIAVTLDGKTVLLNNNGTWEYFIKEDLNYRTNSIEIPAIHKSDSLIKHQAYSLVFDKFYQQAKWVAYELTKEETVKKVDRSDKFLPDPKISFTNHDIDYALSGYDRGHLAPAGDMSWDENVMKESFYYSNMSPQVPAFNRGIWKRLEDQARKWAIENEALLIVSGPILNSPLQKLGPNKIAIPSKYFKIVVDYCEPELKGLAFIMNNEGSTLPLQHFAVSIDSVQKITGINFFPNFTQLEEKEIENQICLPCWSWGSQMVTAKPILTSQKKQVEIPVQPSKIKSTQCDAITKSGKRCLRITTDSGGKCYQHQQK